MEKKKFTKKLLIILGVIVIIAGAIAGSLYSLSQDGTLNMDDVYATIQTILPYFFWYFISWVIISIGAAALQGLYKTPTYDFLMGKCGESLGMTLADIVTMLINCVISFWVFFPVMKIIFKEK